MEPLQESIPTCLLIISQLDLIFQYFMNHLVSRLTLKPPFCGVRCNDRVSQDTVPYITNEGSYVASNDEETTESVTAFLSESLRLMSLQATPLCESKHRWAGWLVPAGSRGPLFARNSPRPASKETLLANQNNHSRSPNSNRFRCSAQTRRRWSGMPPAAPFSQVSFLHSRHRIHFEPVSGRSTLSS